MLPDFRGSVMFRITMAVIALAAAAVFLLHSSAAKPVALQAAEQRLEAAELQQDSMASRTAVVVSQAAEARAATKPALARVESLRSRVAVRGPSELLVQDTGAPAPTAVAVPPLVTERIQADSAAIGALIPPSRSLLEESPE